jgi:hypothetical protein
MIKRVLFWLFLIAYFAAVTFSLMLACANVYFKFFKPGAA